MKQKATSRTTFGCVFYHLEHFSIFKTGHPEKPKIHEFDSFSTFQIGHPDNPKIHHVVHFSTFPSGFRKIIKSIIFTTLAISRISRSLTR